MSKPKDSYSTSPRMNSTATGKIKSFEYVFNSKTSCWTRMNDSTTAGDDSSEDAEGRSQWMEIVRQDHERESALEALSHMLLQ